ncbi:STAS domain-containing protein [Jatrophihabitans endophyticus]|uniref:STAS domain-containing protein n=1 Tax=Jatrophihabitans endophyticus TaxID=1206085 RepID=UPI0019E6B155|nr:STAS domain-containing protein [Jatrophihabitans endophyticus]MBE7187107.1 STAS domain-containing protein [Jatrophihabitans endophyticus]
MHRRCDLEIAAIYDDDGHVTVQLSGEMDLQSSPLLPAVVADAVAGGRTSVRLDLSRLRFCDCAGLRAFLETNGIVFAGGGSMTLVGVRPRFRRLLTLSLLDDILTVDDDSSCHPVRLGVVDATGVAVRNRRR